VNLIVLRSLNLDESRCNFAVRLISDRVLRGFGARAA